MKNKKQHLFRADGATKIQAEKLNQAVIDAINNGVVTKKQADASGLIALGGTTQPVEADKVYTVLAKAVVSGIIDKKQAVKTGLIDEQQLFAKVTEVAKRSGVLSKTELKEALAANTTAVKTTTVKTTAVETAKSVVNDKAAKIDTGVQIVPAAIAGPSTQTIDQSLAASIAKGDYSPVMEMDRTVLSEKLASLVAQGLISSDQMVKTLEVYDLAHKEDPAVGDSADDAPADADTPAEEPDADPEEQPTEKLWTLLGVSMKPLWWVLSGAGAVALLTVVIVLIAKKR